jgi:hypothetical protein
MWITILICVVAAIIIKKFEGVQKQSEDVKKLKDEISDLNRKVDQDKFQNQAPKLRYLFVDKTIAGTTAFYNVSKDILINLFEKQKVRLKGGCSQPFLADLVVEMHPVGDDLGLFVMLPVCGVCNLDGQKYYKRRLVFAENSINTIKAAVLEAYGDMKNFESQPKEPIQTRSAPEKSESNTDKNNSSRKHVLLWIEDSPGEPFPVLLTATEAAKIQLGKPMSIDDSEIAAGLIYAYGCANHYSELPAEEMEESIERIAQNIPQDLIKSSDPVTFLCEDLSIGLRDHFGSEVMLVYSIGCYKLTNASSFRRCATLDLYDLLVKEIKELSQPNQLAAWVMESENFAIHSLDKTVLCKDPRMRYAVSVIKSEIYDANFPDFTVEEKNKIGGVLGTVCGCFIK